MNESPGFCVKERGAFFFVVISGTLVYPEQFLDRQKLALFQPAQMVAIGLPYANFFFADGAISKKLRESFIQPKRQRPEIQIKQRMRVFMTDRVVGVFFGGVHAQQDKVFVLLSRVQPAGM